MHIEKLEKQQHIDRYARETQEGKAVEERIFSTNAGKAEKKQENDQQVREEKIGKCGIQAKKALGNETEIFGAGLADRA